MYLFLLATILLPLAFSLAMLLEKNSWIVKGGQLQVQLDKYTCVHRSM